MMEAGRDFITAHPAENRRQIAGTFIQLRGCNMRTEGGRRDWYHGALIVVRRHARAWGGLIDETTRYVRRGMHRYGTKRAREEEHTGPQTARNLEDVLQQVRRKFPVEHLCHVGTLIKVAQRPAVLKDDIVEAELRREMVRRERADPGLTWMSLSWAEVVATFGDQVNAFEEEHGQGLQFMRMVRRAVARAACRRWGLDNGVEVAGSLTYGRIARSMRDI
jgi:hypothetical protein